VNATGRNILYFGCRHKEKDYLYREELGIVTVCVQNVTPGIGVLL
jgi:sulfite reductase alpha subunit-like flavoprotein